MKVLHLNTHDTKGGAARSMYRLHTGMVAAGIDSRILVRSKWSQDERVASFANSDSLLNRIFRRVRYSLLEHRVVRLKAKAPKGSDLFSIDQTDCLITCENRADIINLHWVAGFVDVSTFFRMNRSTPIVWRFSDLNPITGGCHYDGGCGKYLNFCENCPQLGPVSCCDPVARVWKRKQKAFDDVLPGGLHLVAQSSWMAEQMKQSPLVGRFPVTVIANGIDTDIYRPASRYGLRSSLGIADDEQVLLFVAGSTQTKRKGLPLLLDALSRIDDKVWLVSVGGNRPAGGRKHEKHIWLGKVESDKLLAAIYTSADLFVLPSLQDNLPNTAIEAMACGTPVVGFDSGGLCDIVDSGVTGRLVPAGNVSALADIINTMLRDRATLKGMRAVCRKNAVDMFYLPRQVRRLTDFYHQILDDRKTATN